MCGIVGIVNCSSSVIENTVIAMRDRLLTRGPDHAGLWISNDRAIGLGHRRLSIIDLSSNGHQPMTNEDGSLHLVYNGEIYNFCQLKDQLIKKGHIFHSQTDTEVILHAYEEWNFECVKYFNGIFAFALWDNKRKILFAARDRYGVKPFYFCNYSKKKFAFASQVKCFLEIQEFNPELDLEALWLFLNLRRVPSPKSIFKNCRTLSPGSYLIWDNKKYSLQIKDFWCAYSKSVKPYKLRDEEELVYNLDYLLEKAIKSQLVSDVPLGAFLSGGIDSSTIVAMMAKYNSNIKTFTVGFKDQIDEAPYAKKVANIFGTTHYELYISKQDLINSIHLLPEIYDEPFADSSAIPTYWISKFTKQHVTVSLSGDGGDELFGGYDYYDFLNKIRYLSLLPYSLRKWIVSISNQLPWGKLQKLINILDFQGQIDLLDNIKSCWKKNELPRLMPNFQMNDESDNYIDINHKRDFISQMMLKDFRYYLSDELLTKVDRSSMFVSLESRVPILDNDLVDFVLGIPSEFKVRGNDHKYLLKKVLKKYVPSELIERPKRGFGAPMDTWLRRELRWMIDLYLNPVKIKKQSIFNEKIVEKAVMHFLNNRSSHYRIWALIVFQMWADFYNVTW
jgi:asparagine synthase (glutamine-hydrolysing)